MIKKIFLYLRRKDLISFFSIILLIIIGNLLEVLSIGTIPIFLNFALNPSELIEKIPGGVQNLVNDLDYEQNYLIIIFSLILFLIFCTKKFISFYKSLLSGKIL